MRWSKNIRSASKRGKADYSHREKKKNKEDSFGQVEFSRKYSPLVPQMPQNKVVGWGGSARNEIQKKRAARRDVASCRLVSQSARETLVGKVSPKE